MSSGWAAPIDLVRRGSTGVEVKAHGAEWELFDEVIFATHSDDTLRLLADATAQEQADLGAIKYQPNDIVLHADASVMPKRRAVWSSWNYAEAPAKRDGQIDITYWMNYSAGRSAFCDAQQHAPYSRRADL